ncbi:hypothetical protein U3516DRAFT_763185 [Neocallimastix sp. 'constans']
MSACKFIKFKYLQLFIIQYINKVDIIIKPKLLTSKRLRRKKLTSNRRFQNGNYKRLLIKKYKELNDYKKERTLPPHKINVKLVRPNKNVTSKIIWLMLIHKTYKLWLLLNQKANINYQ